MREYIYPIYYEIYKGSAILAKKAIVKAYEEMGSISEVSRLYRSTRKTERKVVRRWQEAGEEGLKDRWRWRRWL